MTEQIDPKHLIFELEDLLRTRPEVGRLHEITDENLSWLGRSAAVVEQWHYPKMVLFGSARTKLDSGRMTDSYDGYRDIVVLLYQALQDLKMKTGTTVNISISQGSIFEYFDEIRKIIEMAASDILFVDPYLDADFISRYLPHVNSMVTVRLLTSSNKLDKLLPSVELFTNQNKTIVNVRSSVNLHDRYMFLDRSKCYQSGASFKDGAKRSPTTLTEISDAFSAVWRTYEEFWDQAKVER